MPSAPGARVREVLALLDELGLRCRTVPSMSQLAVGDMVTALRPVEIADVLGRESVDLGTETVREFLDGKTVLVTGAGGSIGSELCRQLAQLGPSKLVLVERSEFQLFEIHSEIEGAIKAVPELIDVQDTPAMEAAFERYSPDVIFHAAAFKHVSMMERQPAVAIRNNVLATDRLAVAAAEHGVGRFILISTDKAVAPSSVMGATKALAERVLQGHAMAGGGTRFITVRFGNVLGSSGSVVPIFQRQIELGGPVTVTDAAVTRFFMSIPEAAGLVLRSAAMGEGGDRFILDMGEPVRIAELAEDMIRLTGREPGTDIAIEFIGLAPGRKTARRTSLRRRTIGRHRSHKNPTHHRRGLDGCGLARCWKPPCNGAVNWMTPLRVRGCANCFRSTNRLRPNRALQLSLRTYHAGGVLRRKMR